MGRNRKDFNPLARLIVAELNTLDRNEYMKAPMLLERINEKSGLELSIGELKGIITYIKDCPRTLSYETYINWYIVSGPYGYALLKNVDAKEVAKCYKKYISASRSESLRINPLKMYLFSNGWEESDIDNVDIEISDFERERYETLAMMINTK